MAAAGEDPDDPEHPDNPDNPELANSHDYADSIAHSAASPCFHLSSIEPAMADDSQVRPGAL